MNDSEVKLIPFTWKRWPNMQTMLRNYSTFYVLESATFEVATLKVPLPAMIFEKLHPWLIRTRLYQELTEDSCSA